MAINNDVDLYGDINHAGIELKELMSNLYDVQRSMQDVLKNPDKYDKDDLREWCDTCDQMLKLGVDVCESGYYDNMHRLEQEYQTKQVLDWMEEKKGNTVAREGVEIHNIINLLLKNTPQAGDLVRVVREEILSEKESSQ